MGYKAFLEENLVMLNMPIFLEESASYYDLQQEAIDRDKVKHILENRKFTEDNFASDTFEEADAIKMICKYNAIGINETFIVHDELLPFDDYPQTAKDGLAEVFRRHKLLCPDISTEDFVLLLTTGKPSCKYVIPPYTTNRDVGIVFNILVAAGALKNRWAATICKSGMLFTSTGIKMNGKNLSAAVHWFDNYKLNYLSDKQKKIERDVMKVLANVPSAARHLKK